MNIILISSRLKTARTLNVTPRHAVIGAVVFVLVSLVVSFAFSWIGIRLNLPFASEIVVQVQQKHQQKNEEYLRENVTAMAVKLGEMQAQVIRLDSLSERISKLSGVPLPKSETGGKSGKDAKDTKDGKGGPLINPSLPLSADELKREIDRLAEIVEQRGDEFTALESQLMEKRIKNTLLPTLLPIEADHIGSSFGRRIDPIAGVGAMHEGIDFVADVGTKVTASAGGVVVTAEYHPQYGKMIEIDHGNDFSSRYAHLSSIGVKAGQIVRRGQLIGASGNTGRSTGPHLHFEVRFKGVAQNPARFLQPGTATALVSREETDPGVALPRAGAKR